MYGPIFPLLVELMAGSQTKYTSGFQNFKSFLQIIYSTQIFTLLQYVNVIVVLLIRMNAFQLAFLK